MLKYLQTKFKTNEFQTTLHKIKFSISNIDDIQIFVYDIIGTRVFEIFKHTNKYIHLWLAQFYWDSCWVHLHSHARYMKWISNIQINSLLPPEINLPISCDFFGNKIRNGAEQKAKSHVSRSMEYVRIFNSWVDSFCQCVLSLQVFFCLPVYAHLWGQIQCEEMTVAISAVVGSILTRITC